MAKLWALLCTGCMVGDTQVAWLGGETCGAGEWWSGEPVSSTATAGTIATGHTDLGATWTGLTACGELQDPTGLVYVPATDGVHLFSAVGPGDQGVLVVSGTESDCRCDSGPVTCLELEVTRGLPVSVLVGGAAGETGAWSLDVYGPDDGVDCADVWAGGRP